MEKRFNFTPEEYEAPSEKPFEPDSVLENWMSGYSKQSSGGEGRERKLAEEAIKYGDKRSLKELLALRTRDLEDLVYRYRRENPVPHSGWNKNNLTKEQIDEITKENLKEVLKKPNLPPASESITTEDLLKRMINRVG